MNVNDAMARIDEIQSHLQRTETFRGYRSAAVGATGVLACGGAIVQYYWLSNPMQNFRGWLSLWIAIAGVSLCLTAGEVIFRMYDRRSPRVARANRSAVFKFLPCLFAGAAIAWALMAQAPDTLWLLPGVWSVLFSLGVFSSLPILPRSGLIIALHYLFAGIFCLRFGYGFEGESMLAPWTMLISFGIGQILSAAVLYFELERPARRIQEAETND